MSMRVLAITVLSIWTLATRSRGQAGPEIDWGTDRVTLQEAWPGAEAGRDWTRIPVGVGLWRRAAGPDMAMEDHRNGWTSKDNHGYGISGVSRTEFPATAKIEVKSFKRRGGTISLVVIVHPTGGRMPESVKDVVRRKLNRAEDRSAVTFDDANAVNLGGRRVSFAGQFPDDLPIGEYLIAVECRDETGKSLEEYEQPLVRLAAMPNPLRAMTDGQLITEYLGRGEALKGTAIEPIDSRVGHLAAAFPYERSDRLAWRDAHAEIVRRGAVMVPELMTLFESEAVRNPGQTPEVADHFGLAFDVMDMLSRSNDPRPVALLIRAIRGMDGQANPSVRDHAVETTERLTYMSFRVDRIYAVYEAVPDRSAVVVPRDPDKWESDGTFKSVADQYEKWLAGEGRDPTQWLKSARLRARIALEGDDAIAVENAVVFLAGIRSSGDGHDDSPEDTMRAMAVLIDRHAEPAYRDLLGYFSNYGPAARPYVGRIIDLGIADPFHSPVLRLSIIGGEQAMAYLVKELPRLSQQLDQFGLSADANHWEIGDPQARWVVLNYLECRWGIERWAGRTFATDQDIARWWEQHKGQTQQQWLEQNMDRTAVEADEGNAKAQYLLRLMMPDLPYPEADRQFVPPMDGGMFTGYREAAQVGFRGPWLNEHRPKLRYDAKRSCFVLAAA